MPSRQNGSRHSLHVSTKLCFFQGESVEENANLVVRLLIRRPECLGPSLCGEGGQGLLAAVTEALEICKDPSRDEPDRNVTRRR